MEGQSTFSGLDKVTNVDRLTSTISIDFLYLPLSESLQQWCNKKYQMGQALKNTKVDLEETVNYNWIYYYFRICR